MLKFRRPLFILIILLVIPVLFLSLNSYAAKVDLEALPVSFPISYPMSYAIGQVYSEPMVISKDGKTYKFDKRDSNPEVIADVSGAVSNARSFIAYTRKSLNSWGIEPKLHIYDINTQKENDGITLVDDGVNKFVSGWSPRDDYVVLQNEAQAVGTEKAYIYDTKLKKQILTLNLYTYLNKWIDQDNFLYLNQNKESVTINVYNIRSGVLTILGSFNDIDNPFPHIDNIYLLKNKLQISISTFTQVPSDSIAIVYKETRKYYNFDLQKKSFTILQDHDTIEDRVLSKFQPKDKSNFKIDVLKQYDNGNYLVNIYPTIEGLNSKSIVLNMDAQGDISNSYMLNI